jgi:hypothetical protein
MNHGQAKTLEALNKKIDDPFKLHLEVDLKIVLNP